MVSLSLAEAAPQTGRHAPATATARRVRENRNDPGVSRGRVDGGAFAPAC